MKRLVAVEPGGLERLSVIDVPTPSPGPKDVLIAIAYSGVNFIDVYFRNGLYKSDAPIALGSEAAGTVEQVGAEVTDLQPGDRVVYAMHRGSHAEYAVVPAVAAAKIPDAVDFKTAAAAMLQGTTAHYLTHSTFVLDARHTCLVHAAAGGAGGLIVRMAKGRGARVIGTASTDAKVAEALNLGADHVVKYTTDDFETEVRRLTGGHGVDVVYDSVGRTTFDKSLKVLKPRGLLALFGQSSGAVHPIDPGILNAHGSLFLTRPSLAHHLATRDEVAWRVGELMDLVISGRLRVRVADAVPLADAADAYRELEGRKTMGKLVLEVRPTR
jgi:NADPH2:quinone reductase